MKKSIRGIGEREENRMRRRKGGGERGGKRQVSIVEEAEKEEI